MDRLCIFIDGENFRKCIGRLFPNDYYSAHYIPWGNYNSLLDQITIMASDELGRPQSLLRCYWYVVDTVTYDNRFNESRFLESPIKEQVEHFKKVCKSKAGGVHIDRSKEETLKNTAERCREFLKKQASDLGAMTRDWTERQNSLQNSTNKLQFKRFGYLKTYLDNGRGKLSFVEEKGVDVNLATEMILYKDIYDTAVLISGDGDYIPAINAIKHLGKTAVVADFRGASGDRLPGGARKLREHADHHFTLDFALMKTIFKYEN